jgi:hypothetical protein
MGEKRMGRARVFLFLLLVMVPAGFGGTITFTPNGSTNVVAGNTVSFLTDVQNTYPQGTFDSIMVIIGSDAPPLDAVDRMTFDFNSDWKNAYPDALFTSGSVGMYNSDIMVNIGNDSSVNLSSSLMGTLTISTEGLSPGEYSIFVEGNTGFNMISLGGYPDDIISSSSTTFTVVPEPVSLLLFIGAGVWGLRPKKGYQ